MGSASHLARAERADLLRVLWLVARGRGFEALLLAMAGRTSVAPELDGAGVPVLVAPSG